MTVTISKIQQVAKGGFARVDAAGEWKTGGKGLGGRVVAWFTGIVSRGRVARENRTAIDHFVQAIGADRRYGNHFSNLAAQTLKPLSDAGKPLRERNVTQILSEIESIRVDRNAINYSTAERFSITDPDSLHQLFAKTLDRISDEHGLSADIGVDAAAAVKTAEDIKQEILAVGASGKNLVFTQDAQEIANHHIGKLVDKLVTLDNILEAADIGEEEEFFLVQQLVDEPDFNKQDILSYIHGRRANQLAYESGELPKMRSQAATAEGIKEIAEDITLQSGVDSDMVVKVTDRIKVDFPDTVATNAEILALFNKEVSSYVVDRKKLMNHADTQNLTREARAEMHKIIAQDPSITTIEHVDAIIAVALGYGPFCQSIGVGGTEEMAAAFVRHQKTFDQAMEPLMHSGMTVNETAPRRTQGLSLWVAQQKDKGRLPPPQRGTWVKTRHTVWEAQPKRPSDSGQSAKVRRDMELAYNNLTGPAGDRWVDSTVWVAEQNRRVDSNVDDVARIVQNMRHAMAAEIGEYLGISPVDGSDGSPTREGIASNISGEADVSDNVYCMFRDLGVKVSPPEIMGRSKKEAFDARFNEHFLQVINEELKIQGDLTDGICSTMYTDLGRANFFTGEPGTPENSLTAARTGDGAEAALGMFNTFFEHDEAGKQAVSRVTNQGVFAAIDKASMLGFGPFSQNILREQSSVKSEINYRIWQEPDGTGYRVQTSLSSPVQSIVNPADMSMRFTDRETSKFSFDATFRISRESINAGNPSAELVTAPNYEYRIDPGQEQEA